jgi:tRNA dimethylallyltransferase
MSDRKLISVVGQTGIGKTKFAIALASHFDTEIISADSRQFYKEMSIGTAVPSTEELQAVRHHFIQHKSIFENYSVGDFERDGIALLDGLFNEKNIVILVGGSGLYIDAITKGLDYFPKVSPEVREALNKQLKNNGIEALQELLKQSDPQYYDTIDLNNPHRLIRALEICIGTGKPYSSFLGKKKSRTFKTTTIGLTAPREIVYERLNDRVDKMIEHGLVEEARSLYEHKGLNALQTVGYTEMFKYFDGDWDLDFAISEIKKNTRRFAKRQRTWFKKNEHTHWINYQFNIDEVLRNILTK